MSRFLIAVVAALETASALADNTAPQSAAPQKAAAQGTAQNVAMVNSQPITKASIDQFVQQLGQPDTPELRDRIKEQLIEREVFLQEASKRGIPDRADVKFQLDFVRKFEDLAKKSKDPGSGSRGGDLGWAAPSAYVKAFSDAMVKLEKGKYTDVPVQTQFGYHVIQLEDVRETQFPPLDQVKSQITETLQNKQAQAFAEDLKKKAKIQ